MARLLLALNLVISQCVFAGLTLWTPVGYDHTFLLPESVTPMQFLQAAKEHPKHSKYLADLRYTVQDQVSIVSELEGSRMRRSLLIANERPDHDQKLTRVRMFSEHRTNSYILPVGAASSLDISDRRKFYSEISKQFYLIIPMGGDDVTPEAYNEKTTYAEGYDLFRDRLEIELIQYFYENSDGKIFGICRGMQITCVALGGKLHQDMILELGIQEDHKDGAYHEIFLTGSEDHPGTQFLSSFSDWKGNSWHHQALNKNSLSVTPLAVIAESREGIVEAAASADNRILLLQSHPEKSDPQTNQARNFFKHLEAWVASPTSKNCRQVLKASP